VHPLYKKFDWKEERDLWSQLFSPVIQASTLPTHVKRAKISLARDQFHASVARKLSEKEMITLTLGTMQEIPDGLPVVWCPFLWGKMIKHLTEEERALTPFNRWDLTAEQIDKWSLDSICSSGDEVYWVDGVQSDFDEKSIQLRTTPQKSANMGTLTPYALRVMLLPPWHPKWDGPAPLIREQLPLLF